MTKERPATLRGTAVVVLLIILVVAALAFASRSPFFEKGARAVGIEKDSTHKCYIIYEGSRSCQRKEGK